MGGNLVKLSIEDEKLLKALHPEESISSWCFRFLRNIPSVKMVLSDMSNMEQMVDNIKTFSEGEPLTQNKTELIFSIAEKMKDSVPCAGCRYCCSGCPMGLDIPAVMKDLTVRLSKILS